MTYDFLKLYLVNKAVDSATALKNTILERYLTQDFVKQMWIAKHMKGEYDRYASGSVPLTLNDSVGKDLVSWSMVGNTIQDGTPSPENPVDVQGVGDWDETEQKYKIPVVSRGKNLFDKDNVNVINGYITSSTFKIVANNSTRTIYIKCKPNTKYTVSKVLSKRFNLAYTTETPQINVTVYGIVQDFNAEHLTITTGVDAKYLCMFMYHASYDTLTYDEIINTIQIESGSTSTTYEPYIEPTTTNIYLNSPLMQGETLSSEGEREVEWGVLKLEPTLSWNYVSNGKGRFTHVINGAKPYDATVVTDARCTHIVADTSNKVYSSETLCFAIQYTGQIWISAAYFNRSMDDFKTWLTTNDVYLYYPLSTHTTETFTPPSIPTETGTTVLDTDCVVAPSSVTAQYKSSKPDNTLTAMMNILSEV